MDDCPICAKHRGEGPLRGALVGRWDGFWVYHAAPDERGLAALGHLFIETDRHVPYLADLSPEESAALGRLRTRLAHELRMATDAEFVLAAVIGLGVAHFHEHLFARFRDTPGEVPWHESDDAAPRADEAAVAALAGRLARAISAS